jgi:hypothetical protein
METLSLKLGVTPLLAAQRSTEPNKYTSFTARQTSLLIATMLSQPK